MTRSLPVSAVVALILAHVIGMIDLVALPVWVGALVARFGFDTAQAGLMVTLFLIGATIASVIVATRFTRMDQRLYATGGFAVAALAFGAASTQTAFGPLAGLHLLAGLGLGTALSMVHGTIGRSANPHRLFAFAGIGLGAFGVVFMGAVPQILIAAGGAALFQVFAGMMVVAALICLLFFANPEHRPEHAAAPFSRAIWFVIAGVALMTFNQAMVFSFVEVIGAQRGFAEAQILAVLIVLGVVNFLVPAPLAALLEKRLSAARVTQFGPLVQAVLALVVTMSTQIQIWAPAAAVFVAVQIFTHTFAFGLLARMDPTGRAVAATPAMLMIGSALGPAVGGALGLNLGFGALGIAGVLVACVSIIAFTLGARRAS